MNKIDLMIRIGREWVEMGESGIERYGHVNQPATDTGSIAVRLSR